MLPIIGIVVVFGAVIAGFLMEKGNILVLLQPSEMVTNHWGGDAARCWLPTRCTSSRR
jgi:flagellar motor component MotA